MATYLITQGTGQQSRAIIEHLLAAGAKVHAIVRDPAKVQPLLKEPGVTLFQGETKNTDDIAAAAKGCTAAFLNTFPLPLGLEAEQSRAFVDACKKTGIKHVVANTTSGTDRKDLWDVEATKPLGLHAYYTSKASIEDIIRGGGFETYTILRPGLIHSDFFGFGAAMNFPRFATHAEIDDLQDDGITMHFTDCDDIGKYGAAALLNPDKFGGQEITLVGDDLNFTQVAEIVTRVSGQQVRAVKRTPEEVEQMGNTVTGQKFQLGQNLYGRKMMRASANDAPAKFGIPFNSLETALTREKARLLETLPAK